MVPVSHAFGSIEEMGDGVFRKVRQELGVTAFGVNAVVLAPGVTSRPHYHEQQDELYFGPSRTGPLRGRRPDTTCPLSFGAETFRGAP